MSGITLPLTLAAGKTASFTLTFKPQSAGSAPATASFASNSSNTPLKVALAGTGTSTGGAGSTPTHSVSLTWKASTSSVAGYNIYRGTKTGGPYAKLNSATDTGTVYMDGTVKAGATYFYVATALSSSGMESATSNEVKTVVPTP
jgi:ABC-type transport system involved in cytochrome c biogenesis permease subunit